MFYCVFGPLLVHLCALCVPVQLYEIMMMMVMMMIYQSAKVKTDMPEKNDKQLSL